MSVTFAIVLYKLSTLIVGLFFAYFGFRLLISGVFEGGGDLNATFSNHRLVLKKSSPGIFFALFGTAVIAIALIKGIDLETTSRVENCQALSLTDEDKIAINTLQEVISGNQNADEISSFEVSSIDDFFKKINSISKSCNKIVSNTVERGIASEE